LGEEGQGGQQEHTSGSVPLLPAPGLTAFLLLGACAFVVRKMIKLT